MNDVTYPTDDEMFYRVLEHYEASANDGERWYRESRKFARRLARAHGRGLGTAAGVIAALSPQVQWRRNKLMAEEVMATGWATGQTGANLEKARRIWLGERPLAVLGGNKVRAFYRAMMGDEDAIVLDTWMATALGWPRDSFTAKQYERCGAVLVQAASMTPHTVAQFQAIVWTHVRGGGE